MFEVIIAILAALGLAALLWLAYGALLLPMGHPDTLEIRVTAAGDGEEAEQTLRSLSWLHRAGLLDAGLVILDEGLTPKGKACLEYLCAKHFSGVRFLRDSR